MNQQQLNLLLQSATKFSPFYNRIGFSDRMTLIKINMTITTAIIDIILVMHLISYFESEKSIKQVYGVFRFVLD